MTEPSVLVTQNNRVTVVTINRPHARNAVDGATAEQLADAFRRFDEDSGSDVAILTGADGTFCAGADLKAVAAGGAERPNAVRTTGDGPMGPSRMLLSKPVIAAVEGYAVAGGIELAAWCDLRVAAGGPLDVPLPWACIRRIRHVRGSFGPRLGIDLSDAIGGDSVSFPARMFDVPLDELCHALRSLREEHA